jgi:hypothetical protein
LATFCSSNAMAVVIPMQPAPNTNTRSWDMVIYLAVQIEEKIIKYAPAQYNGLCHYFVPKQFRVLFILTSEFLVSIFFSSC